MKAAVLVAAGQPLIVTEITPRPVGATDVVVQIGATGVCRTDRTTQKTATPDRLPVIMGHEAVGTVLQIGTDVTRVKVGDRVLSAAAPACGNCWYCLHEKSNLCVMQLPVMTVPRGTLADGAEATSSCGLGTFAETMTVYEWSVVPIRSDLPDEQLALLGCGVTTGLGAVLNTARVEAGTSVAVIGCGGVGQAAIQGARIAGAARIVAIDPVELKRATSEALGATDVVDPTVTDPIEAIQSMTDGRGADYVIEALGFPRTMEQAFAMARPGGTVVYVGMAGMQETITLSAFSAVFSEKRICGSSFGSTQIRRDFSRYIDLVESGQLQLAPMISRTVGLREVNEALATFDTGEDLRRVITRF